MVRSTALCGHSLWWMGNIKTNSNFFANSQSVPRDNTVSLSLLVCWLSLTLPQNYIMHKYKKCPSISNYIFIPQWAVISSNFSPWEGVSQELRTPHGGQNQWNEYDGDYSSTRSGHWDNCLNIFNSMIVTKFSYIVHRHI